MLKEPGEGGEMMGLPEERSLVSGDAVNQFTALITGGVLTQELVVDGEARDMEGTQAGARSRALSIRHFVSRREMPVFAEIRSRKSMNSLSVNS